MDGALGVVGAAFCGTHPAVRGHQARDRATVLRLAREEETP